LDLPTGPRYGLTNSALSVSHVEVVYCTSRSIRNVPTYLTTCSKVLLENKVDSQSRTFPPFMEPESSQSCSQGSATGTYPEPNPRPCVTFRNKLFFTVRSYPLAQPPTCRTTHCRMPANTYSTCLPCFLYTCILEVCHYVKKMFEEGKVRPESILSVAIQYV